MTLRWPQAAPKGFQESPKRAQNGPRMAKDGPKMAQHSSKMGQNAPLKATRHTYVPFRATIFTALAVALQLLSTGGHPRAICYNNNICTHIDWDAS